MLDDPLVQGLNPQQAAAVVHSGTPLLVVAGAGSGKTRVLTRRIAYLMARRNVRPFEILAITFTNKAAGEMKERVADLVGPIAKSMWVSTFHSACVRILRVEAHRLGYSNNFTIYDSADSQRLIALVCKDLNLDPKRYPPRQFASTISNAKNELLGPADYLNSTNNQYEQICADVYSLYQKRLGQANAMDFDDLLLNTHIILEKFPDVLYKYQHKFRYVLIDEFQDTNYLQYEIVRKIADVFQNITVVGDDAQSIYAFRGATIDNILNFEKDFPELKVFMKNHIKDCKPEEIDAFFTSEVFRFCFSFFISWLHNSKSDRS